MSVEEFLKIVLGLPEVTQNHGHPSLIGFRVRDKGFCYLNEADEGRHAQGHPRGAGRAGSRGPRGLLSVLGRRSFRLGGDQLAKVDPGELAELVTEGWRLSAPKRLAAALTGRPE